MEEETENKFMTGLNRYEGKMRDLFTEHGINAPSERVKGRGKLFPFFHTFAYLCPVSSVRLWLPPEYIYLIPPVVLLNDTAAG